MIRLRMKLRDWLYEVKYAWQRVVRGYDDRDVFSIDYSFMKIYLKILKDFRNSCMSHPHGMTFDEWMAIIDEMIVCLEGMQEDLDRRDFEAEYNEIESNKDRFFELFSKYFFSLWN